MPLPSSPSPISVMCVLARPPAEGARSGLYFEVHCSAGPTERMRRSVGAKSERELFSQSGEAPGKQGECERASGSACEWRAGSPGRDREGDVIGGDARARSGHPRAREAPGLVAQASLRCDATVGLNPRPAQLCLGRRKWGEWSLRVG